MASFVGTANLQTVHFFCPGSENNWWSQERQNSFFKATSVIAQDI